MTQAAVYSALREAAIYGRPCPTNAELVELIGARNAHAVSGALGRLRALGSIQISGRYAWRRVKFRDGMETLTPEEFMGDLVAKAGLIFGVSAHKIVGPSRHRPTARVRHAVYLVGHEAGLSFPQVADALARDHTTAIHGSQQAQIWIERDPDYAARVAELRHAAGLS